MTAGAWAAAAVRAAPLTPRTPPPSRGATLAVPNPRDPQAAAGCGGWAVAPRVRGAAAFIETFSRNQSPPSLSAVASHPCPQAPRGWRSLGASVLNLPGARASFGLRFSAPEGPRGPHAAVRGSEPRGPGGCARSSPRRPGRGRGLAARAPAGLLPDLPRLEGDSGGPPRRGPRGRGCPGRRGRARGRGLVGAGEEPRQARGRLRGRRGNLPRGLES